MSENRIHTVDLKIVKRYTKALLAYDKKSKLDPDFTKALFDDVPNIFLTINFTMIPNLKNKTFHFAVPKSPVFNPETAEVCCIVEDDPKIDKYEYRDDLRKSFRMVCPFVTEVLPFTVVKSDYTTFEQKRTFAQSFDFFVADRSIFNNLPSLLGSQFIKQKKMPHKFNNLTSENEKLTEKLSATLSKAKWVVDGRGTCTSCICGNSTFTADELVANIDAILSGIAKEGPRGWKFIKSIHIKMEKSIALKVYEKDVEIKVPLKLSELELVHKERTEMKNNELVKLYANLQQRKRPPRKNTGQKQKNNKRRAAKRPLLKTTEAENQPSKSIKIDE